MQSIKTCFWQPYTTLLPEEEDDLTIIADKQLTLAGCRRDYRTCSYGYSLCSPCCIFGALIIISTLGLSGVLPSATSGWIIAGLGGSVIAANILMGNIKNRFAFVSNYTMIGAIILGIGLAGAFGALSGMVVGIAVLTTWLIGSCFGCYFAIANPFAQAICNKEVALALDKEKKSQSMPSRRVEDSSSVSNNDEGDASPQGFHAILMRQLQQDIDSPSSSTSSEELEKKRQILQFLKDMNSSSSSDSSSSDSSDSDD